MTIYFNTELSNDNLIDPWRIEIERSIDVKRRMSNLQTSNPDELATITILSFSSRNILLFWTKMVEFCSRGRRNLGKYC